MRYISGPINQEIRMRTVGRMALRMSVMQHYKETMLDLEPAMEDMNLDTALEPFEMGCDRDDERYLCQAEAEDIIHPLLEKACIVSGLPVSVHADAYPDVEAVQTCEAIWCYVAHVVRTVIVSHD